MMYSYVFVSIIFVNLRLKLLYFCENILYLHIMTIKQYINGGGIFALYSKSNYHNPILRTLNFYYYYFFYFFFFFWGGGSYPLICPPPFPLYVSSYLRLHQVASPRPEGNQAIFKRVIKTFVRNLWFLALIKDQQPSCFKFSAHFASVGNIEICCSWNTSDITHALKNTQLFSLCEYWHNTAFYCREKIDIWDSPLYNRRWSRRKN